jgi:hypothetical protein
LNVYSGNAKEKYRVNQVRNDKISISGPYLERGCPDISVTAEVIKH